MKTSWLLLLLLFPLAAFAQMIHGVVKDGETGAALQGVAVTNMITNQTDYTNKDGAYSLSAKNGDAIAFMFIGYKTVQRDAHSSLGAAADLDVTLFKLSYNLEEFVFRPDYTPYQLDSIQRKSTYSRALARRRSSVLSPVSFIAERLSKRSKRIFRFQKNFYKWEDARFIDSRYTATLAASLTGLSGDTLAHFMNENPMPYDFARVASELEMKMWIRDKFRHWKSNEKDATLPE